MTDITIDHLTTNEIEGMGVFDELMRSVKAHLIEEQSRNGIIQKLFPSITVITSLHLSKIVC